VPLASKNQKRTKRSAHKILHSEWQKAIANMADSVAVLAAQEEPSLLPAFSRQLKKVAALGEQAELVQLWASVA